MSNKNSTHNQNIIKDPNVHLVYADKGDMQFLNVYGKAKISTDKFIIDALYSKADSMWFEGKDDPNITAIGITPKEAYYWDPKNNKLVTLVKLGVSALSGEAPDTMDYGKLKL
ncbi:pyridoxamine 5'-phosphate oxidase family protein [Formosa undariae]|uniref:Pyridoxamine 5'-phosphate oxidase family protein n=1 Tax=Formosa undariae TaxID=1325436 RepID=A0ABV5F333_9FLAO